MFSRKRFRDSPFQKFRDEVGGKRQQQLALESESKTNRSAVRQTRLQTIYIILVWNNSLNQ